MRRMSARGGPPAPKPKRKVAIAPPGPDPFEAGIEAHRAGRPAGATAFSHRATARARRASGALTTTGIPLPHRRRFAAAAAAHRKALELSPDDPGILSNLGNALKDDGRFDEAIAIKHRVIELSGETSETLHSLGIALRDAGRLDEADAAFARALALKPDDPEIRFNLALTQLHLENFASGWQHYEARWQLERQKKRAFAQPWWHGGPFLGRTLLLFAEQGFGDTIQFIRFGPQVKALGGKVVLECQPELMRLMRSAEGIDELVVRGTPEAEAMAASADLVCPLASLPGIFRASLTEPQGRVPYLAPPPGTGRKFAPLLARARGRLKVGIVWSGSITFSNNANRSAGLEPYLPLAGVPGVQLIGLQKGPRLDELKALVTGSLILDAGPLLEDFADTAALIQELDLVLMTDSAVAHLTGALGRPIWVMLMHHPDWRWLRDRPDCPWYPSARLFRQRTPRDWEGVFDEVGRELARLAASRNVET